MTQPQMTHREKMQPYHGPFGIDGFGRRAESFARLFGAPQFLVGQTILVGGWIVLNAMALFYSAEQVEHP